MLQIVIAYKTFERSETPEVIYTGHDGADLFKAVEANAGNGFVRMERVIVDRGIPVEIPPLPESDKTQSADGIPPATEDESPEDKTNSAEAPLQSVDGIQPASPSEEAPGEQAQMIQDEPEAPVNEPARETAIETAAAPETFFSAPKTKTPAPVKAPRKNARKSDSKNEK
jgi:hypothetical protein